jgi:hypothetical protein
MYDVNQHDRFVVTRRRRMTPAPFMSSVDFYEFGLADGDADAPPVCHVRQRVHRPNARISFYADDARTRALMHLNPRPRYDPWARYELVDGSLQPIGEIQKAFVPRVRRSHYILYGDDGAEVGRVEARVPAAVARRRAGGVAVVAAGGALASPVIGAPAVATAAAAAAVRAAVRQIGDYVDPIDAASELRILRGDQVLGVFVRRPRAGAVGPGSTVPVPWAGSASVYEIDMSADSSKTVDRRLVLAVLVALDALRGVVADSALR